MGEVQVNFFPRQLTRWRHSAGCSRPAAIIGPDNASSGPVFAQALAAVACILASASLPFFLSRIEGTLTPAEYRPSSTAVCGHLGPGAAPNPLRILDMARFGAGTTGKVITDSLHMPPATSR